MELRGINFRPVANAAGTQGFFGEGDEYWYHPYWKKYAGLTFDNTTFIAKTTTFTSRAGNMPLKQDGITPKEWKPKCMVIKPLSGVVLNAVGLSGPGTIDLLQKKRWQARNGEPFFLSFMSVAEQPEDRLWELKAFVGLLKHSLSQFHAPVGLEINFSCPNTSLNPGILIDEVGTSLDVANQLSIPLQCKFNAAMSVKAVCGAGNHPACDAITISNTIPWGLLPERIDWVGLFGSAKSPLHHLGGGGLSGPPLLPLMGEWIDTARGYGFRKPIWACGGIDSVKAVQWVKVAGASGIQLGTVAITRPWRMKKIIACGNQLFN